MSTIRERLDLVRARIASAASRAGRADPIRLVAVSKGQPSQAIVEAVSAGQIDIGENYVQELSSKARELEHLSVAWHFIGHLQRNKVRDVVEVASMIHTVDRPELADEIAKRAPRPIEVLLEVNVAREPQKSGCDPDLVTSLASHVSKLDGLVLRGLMTVPPVTDDAEGARPHFRALREMGSRLVDAGLVRAPLELSMGMSHDFDVAIEEGATIVRVGTDIFGPRAAKAPKG
ncbi:MAG: YggS family pyridoxal phosphate-dependent enzyme [Polyangiaceae bacterium]|nr:YggS family pyridoxal phosphate-dependent enzyme [Polyangiaceae bacterium]